jgi:hypothetical protein
MVRDARLLGVDQFFKMYEIFARNRMLGFESERFGDEALCAESFRADEKAVEIRGEGKPVQRVIMWDDHVLGLGLGFRLPLALICVVRHGQDLGVVARWVAGVWSGADFERALQSRFVQSETKLRERSECM